MRLFFAMFPDPETRQRIEEISRGLDLDLSSPRVRPENYHLTLAFIGEVPDSQVPMLRQIGASQVAAACNATFDAWEHWPEARVIVAATRETPAPLEGLWHRLHADLAQHHLALEPKPPRPHVTIARKVSQPPVLSAMPPFTWAMRAFSLVQSTAAGLRPVYTVLDTWPLLDENVAP